MSRPDPIQYAERLYTAIRAANFSPISFLAFGNAVKDGTDFRRMPRMAAEPFMRVVGEMLDLEEDAPPAGDVVEVDVVSDAPSPTPVDSAAPTSSGSSGSAEADNASPGGATSSAEPTTTPSRRHRDRR
jgi:hypothetical protein